jgi:hypothetical protein
LPFFHILQIISLFSSIFSISFHISTYFSSMFSISFHYSTYFSSISFRKVSRNVKWYGKYGRKVSRIVIRYGQYLPFFHILQIISLFSSIFSISFHYSTYFSSISFISFHTYIKLETQCAEPVSLSFHSAYIGPDVSLPMFQLVLC